MSTIRELAAAGVWPLLVFLGVIAGVTAIALCRAKRDDIPRIFEAFAAAFGLHRAIAPLPESLSNTDDDGKSAPTAQEPDLKDEEPA